MVNAAGIGLPLRIVIAQGAIALVCALMLLVLSVHEALSALAAGFICVVANGWYALRLARTAQPGGLIVLWMVRSLVMALLMVATFVWWAPAALGFFGTLVLAQVAYVWSGPRTLDREK